MNFVFYISFSTRNESIPECDCLLGVISGYYCDDTHKKER